MDFNGNEISGLPSEVKFEDVCTSVLTAGQVSVGSCGTTPLFTLPTSAPPAGTPGSRVVMTALQAGEQVFRIPNVTFKWRFQDGVGTFHAVDVPFAAGDYSLEDDIFPTVEDQFQAVLAPLTASGDYQLTLSLAGHVTLTLTNGNSIQQTQMLSAALSDNGYLGMTGNALFFGNAGSLQAQTLPVYTTIPVPIMAWEPYSLVDTPAVTNPMDSNLDANNFSIKKLGYINLIKTGTPASPINPEVTIYVDINGNISTLDSTGLVQTLNAARIVSPDGTSSIFCNNSGAIVQSFTSNNMSSGTVIFNNISTPGGALRFLNFQVGTKLFRIDNVSPFLQFQDSSGLRFAINTVTTEIYAADLLTGMVINNGSIQFTNTTSIQGSGSLLFQRLDFPNTMLIGDVDALGLILGHVGITTTINGTFNVTNMDRANAGALNIAAANATSVNVARVGVTTNVLGDFVVSNTSILQGNVTSNGITTLNEVRTTTDPFNFCRNGTAVDIRVGQAGKTFDVEGKLTIKGQYPGSYGVLAASGINTISATTTETVLISAAAGGSATLPANSIIVGDTYSFFYGGTIAATTPNIRFRVRGTTGGITGAVLFDTGLINNVLNGWTLSGSITFRTTGAAGVGICNSNFTFINGNNALSIDFQNTTTVDTTVANTLSGTIQWSSVAGNLTRRIGYITKLM